MKSETIKLRRYRMEDVLVIHRELGCNPEMTRYTGWNPYATQEATAAFVRQIIDGYDRGDDVFSWVIESSGTAVGTIGAYDYDERGEIEIGYSIFQSCWGRGFASEAVRFACEILFSHEKIQCIKAWSAQENDGSKRVLEKNGFRKTRCAESEKCVNGKPLHQVFYEKRRTPIA